MPIGKFAIIREMKGKKKTLTTKFGNLRTFRTKSAAMIEIKKEIMILKKRGLKAKFFTAQLAEQKIKFRKGLSPFLKKERRVRR